VPPTNSALPTISGTPQQGDQLTADPGTWSGDTPITYDYQWSDGQTGNPITLSSADVGQNLSVTVTASNDAGPGTAPATSNTVGPVLPLPPSPTSGSGPAITGTPQQGETLNVSNGTWGNGPTAYAYEWEDCDSSGTVCGAIAGATSSSYKLQASDVGSTIVAVVTASNSGGQGSATSATVSPVLPAAPVVTSGSGPVMTGTAQQGDTLKVSNGAWNNGPTQYAYAWEDCNSSGTSCSPITGAASSAYTLQASDVGSFVAATVTASNAGGQGSATVATTAAVLPAAPVVTPGSGPAITGTAQQGDTLNVSNGAWSNSPTQYSYVWKDCNSSGTSCSPITGATSSSYTIQASDVGSFVAATVTASNAGGQGSATVATTAAVLPAAPVVTPGSGPAITGTAQQGNTLNVSNGGWSNTPTQYSYVWKDCNSSGTSCSPIGGATSSSYTVQVSDVGSFVAATVTASNAGGHGSATSAVTRVVLPAVPQDSTAPGITGSAQQGETLNASNGIWKNNPTGYSFAWEDCIGSGTNCTAISGAKSSTYKLTAGDVGKYVSVTVTASNLGGQTPVTSASVGPVLPPAPVNTTAPSVSGTAEQGKTLTVTNGSWSNAPTKYSYAWEQCNSSGNCSPIPGATSSSYTLSAVDIGATIACVVTASGPGGQTAASSGKTAAVAEAPTPPGSLPTTTSLLATPTRTVTNQPVTLIATVTSIVTTSTALWGTVTFEDGSAPIEGCADMAVTPSGQSATVACSTSFAASTAHLTAVFSPTAGSILAGSASPGEAVVVGLDATATTLDVSPTVNVGATTTYTATVTPPPSRPGPLEPTGSVRFTDGGQPIASCAGQPLTNGAATCTVYYATAGAHSITARYVGDANFTGSSSPAESVSVAPVPTNVLGTITATMEWAFYFTPSYTKVSNLVVNGVPSGATVLVNCSGRGCPFAHHTSALSNRTRCGKKRAGMCFMSGSFNITPGFASRPLSVGTRVAVEIVLPEWVGKYYRFTMRARRGPRVQIACLAPGGSIPGAGC
jgi:hypothetical protein